MKYLLTLLMLMAGLYASAQEVDTVFLKNLIE